MHTAGAWLATHLGSLQQLQLPAELIASCRRNIQVEYNVAQPLLLLLEINVCTSEVINRPKDHAPCTQDGQDPPTFKTLCKRRGAIAQERWLGAS
jgi:hypothetical protein